MKEVINTVNGRKPVLNVIKASSPTPWLICAKNAISGAIDNIKNDTLFGFALPLTVSIRYAAEPAAPIRAPTIMKFLLSIRR